MSSTLHVIIGCPLCTQAILTSRLCGLEIALKFYQNTEEFNKQYKNGIVDKTWGAPVLVDSEAGVLNQNRAINKYFASVSNTEAGKKLLGKTLFEQSIVDEWLEKFMALEAPFMVLHQNTDKSKVESSLKSVKETLGHLETQLENHKYLIGDYMSLVDLRFISLMVQGRRIVVDKPILAAYKKVEAYLTAAMSQDYYTSTFGKVSPVFIPGSNASPQQNTTANKKGGNKGKKETVQTGVAKTDVKKQETEKCSPPAGETDDSKMYDLVLGAVDSKGRVFSLDLAREAKVDNEKLVGVMKSLESKEYLLLEKDEENIMVLMKEGVDALKNGTAEYRVWAHIPNEGMAMKDAASQLGDLYKFGFQNAARKKWLKLDNATGSIVKVEKSVVDDDRDLLVKISEKKYSEVNAKALALLKKRKFAEGKKIIGFWGTKGPQYHRNLVEKLADLTGDMIQKGTWKDLEFKAFNVNALGKEINTGNFHPLMKVRSEFRRLLLEMGFEEMPTNKYVESSFWNFDTLFQPQQHPARDAHDTFFLSKPKESSVELPEYWERVKNMHEKGDDKSIGWRYNWSFEEAKTNIFRTHTTAMSSRMLYKMAQEGFRPMKLFSIDRVFRNETLDSTHLAEFHQIEGSVCGKGLGLNHLKGIIKAFFNKIGITEMSFKPAYNPYTEPSMEIFVYHPQLKKTIEIGNSGVFRPEMLKPMGLPDDVTVIAWGLSLERPTMLNYKLDNIRDLMGDGINIKDHRKNTAYCLNPATM